jgi:hypothetical protein
VFYIAYYTPEGKQVCESAKTKDKAEARKRLQIRLGEVAEGRYLGPTVERVTVDELIEGLLNDYITNGKRSLKWVRIKINKHVLPYFTRRRAHEITTADIQAYTKQQLEAGASDAEINRELALLKRAYNLKNTESDKEKKTRSYGLFRVCCLRRVSPYLRVSHLNSHPNSYPEREA